MSHDLSTPPTVPSALADLLDRFERMTASRARALDEVGGDIPVAHYHSRERWDDEQRALFGALPIVAGHSSQVPPGSALAFDALGVPIVVTRDRAGALRAFINVCRHRGMALVPADDGLVAKPRASMVCPYHGWTYELDGRLRHRPHAEAFPDLDPSTLGLVELPCAEDAGLIFVSRSKAPAAAPAEWLGDLGDDLRWLGLERMVPFRCVDRVYRANWKLTVDAFLESYHIRVLHRDTIYPFFGDGYAVNRYSGPHLSVLVARRAGFEPHEPARDAAELCRLATPAQLVFPNTFFVWHPDYVSMIRFFSPSPDEVRWVHTMLIPPEKATPDWAAHWEKTFGLIERTVFEREDVATAVAIQAGVRSGANEVFHAGNLEPAVARFHESIEARIRG